MSHWIVILRVIALFCFGFVGLTSAHGQSIDSIKLLPETQRTFVTLFVTNITAPPHIFQIAGEKNRLVMDFKHAKARLGGASAPNGQTRLTGIGHVKSIRYAIRNETGTRIVLDLAKDAKMLNHSEKGDHIVLEIVGRPLTIISSGANALQGVPAPRLKASEPQSSEPQPSERPLSATKPQPVSQDLRSSPMQKQRSHSSSNLSKPRYFKAQTPFPRLKPEASKGLVRRRPVIIIDPGHGGYDPGALGRRKTKEKSVTLAASQELQRQLQATGKYEVVLTRTKDVYIDHEERLKIARKAGADLFISIHADSTVTPSARGASVYTLADRAKNRSRNIVRSQNWIMDVDLGTQSDPVGDILVDLAQRKTASQSDEFSDLLLTQLRGSTRLIGNSHRKAGYFVLLAPDVPAVLLELGFLSNAADEKLLKTSSHRRKLMRSVTRAINTYFNHQRS